MRRSLQCDGTVKTARRRSRSLCEKSPGPAAKIGTDLMESGHTEFRSLGTFSTVVRPAQTLKSPKTGQPVQVPAYRSVMFRAAARLRERLKATGAGPTAQPDYENSRPRSGPRRLTGKILSGEDL